MMNYDAQEEIAYKTAKLESDVTANDFVFPLQRMLSRIDTTFPRREDGGYGRESNSFSRSMMFGFLSATARDLRDAYDKFGLMCNSYTMIPSGSNGKGSTGEQTTNPGHFFICAKYEERSVALYAPIAVKSNRAHINADPYRVEACWEALQNIPENLFHGMSHMQEYLVMVYRASAGAGEVIDLDNIDSKVFGDVLCRKFHYDDNGISLPVIISYSIFSDDIPSGFYTIILPDDGSILTREIILKRLNKLFSPPSFFFD